MREIFKSIPGFPGYEVSDRGNVRSYWKMGVGGLSSVPQRILFPTISEGYPRVQLGRGVHVRVHQLVLLAFIGPCPPGMEACHNDGLRTNCRLNNLRWDTPKNNNGDKRLHGTVQDQRGEKGPKAKLTETAVMKIRELSSFGYSRTALGKMFGVTSGAISSIVLRKNWSHLP